MVIARINVVIELRICSLTHIVKDLTVQHIITTFISKTILSLGRALANNSLLTYEYTCIVVAKALLPFQRIVVGQGRSLLVNHLNLSSSALYSGTTGIAREIGSRAIITVCRYMTSLITHIHTRSEMFSKLIAQVSLDIPFRIQFELIVVTNRCQRIIERTECLIFVLHRPVVLRKQRCRRINYAVTQTRLGRCTIILDRIRARTQHLCAGITSIKTYRKVLKRLKLSLTGDIVTGIVRLLHNSFVIYAVV